MRAAPMMILCSFLVAQPGLAQKPVGDLQDAPATHKPTAVTYLFPEQLTVTADKATPVDLHFRVGAGLHINSHSPHGEELIPTTLSLSKESAVRFERTVFPPGSDYAFAINPKEKLSVYTGDFTIHTDLVAKRGEHLVEATLRYQACNNDSCMPPHSIPVAIDVIAK